MLPRYDLNKEGSVDGSGGNLDRAPAEKFLKEDGSNKEVPL
jgi:hypothetical protein